jgi:Holliday junction DNA helicase RuvA
MIAHLRGRLLDKQPNRLIVDVQGVGYEVHVPLSTFYEVGEVGREVALQVHTHVRDDAITLFGFLTPLERQLFERLIAINGIGPRLALAVLSGIEPLELVAAVRRGDVARLTAIPGVGKKTAERIGLELKDRLPALAEAGAAPTSRRPTPDQVTADVVSALVNLGYHRPLAERAVARAREAGGESDFEPLLRQALRELSRR